MAALWLMLASASHAMHLAYMETAYTHACAGQLHVIATCAESFKLPMPTGVPACLMMAAFLLTVALSHAAGAGAAASSHRSDRARRRWAAAGVDHLPRAGRHCTHLPALCARFLNCIRHHPAVASLCICQPALPTATDSRQSICVDKVTATMHEAAELLLELFVRQQCRCAPSR